MNESEQKDPTGPGSINERESTLPTSFSALQRKIQPRPPFWSALLKSLVGEVRLKHLGLGLLLIALVAVLVARISFTTLPDYKEGDRAVTDVVAMETLAIPSPTLTKLEQEKAVSQIPVVFDYDPNVVKNCLTEFHRYWAESRAQLGGTGAVTERRKVLAGLFDQEFGRAPSNSLLQFLADHHFDPTFEASIAQILQSILEDSVVTTTDVLGAPPREMGVLFHNIDDNTETVIPSSAPVRSVEQAKQQLHSQVEKSGLFPPNLLPEAASAVEGLIAVNALYNQHETAQRKTQASQRVRAVEVEIPGGTVIVRAGQPISAEVLQAIRVIQEKEQRRRRPEYFLGLYLAVLLFFFFIWRFLMQRPVDDISKPRQFVLLVATFVVMLVLTRILLFSFEILIENFSSSPFNDPLSSKLAIPFAAGALLVSLLLDANVGTIYALLFSLFVGYLDQSPVLAIYCLISSLGAIYAVKQYRDRNAVLKASLIVGLTNFLVVVGLNLLDARPHEWKVMVFDLGNTVVGGFFVAGCVSLLLPIFESTFDICTDVRLLELSNLNLPILRRLAAEAPGTYHHSILVGILAEAAAESIGANALLARVACLYHDIGKIVKPRYYIENSKEATQRHEQLAPSMSSLVIIDHVKEGLELARQIHLPRRVMDVIPQHHGTSLVTYFYHKAKNDVDADEVGITEEQFRYPGPRPASKEAALIMLADSIEAASRTVENPNPKKLQNVVDRIVLRFVSDHQLDDSFLTLREITTAKLAFTRALSGIYHQRVAYPGYDFDQAGAELSAS